MIELARDHFTVHPVNEKWFLCKCGRGFKDENKFNQHTETHPKDFSVDWALLLKQQQLNYVEEIMHKCMHCGKILQSAPALR